MTPRITTASSATELIRRALVQFIQNGAGEPYAPRDQPTTESRNVVYQLRDPTRCLMWLPGRKLNYAFAVAEFIWIFCGRDDIAMLEHYNKDIVKFLDTPTTFGAYGPRWRSQIGRVAAELRSDPDSRRAVVGIWRNEIWEPGTTTRDVPCTLSMQYFIRAGQLESSVVMRSSDTWLGLPYDVFTFAMLQRALAAELALPAGPLTIHVGSSHLYARDVERARAVLAAEDAMYQNRRTEHQACEEEDPRLDIIVPGPPGLGYDDVKQAEECIRIGEFFANGAAPWAPLLEVLSFRNHGDAGRVSEPLRWLLD